MAIDKQTRSARDRRWLTTALVASATVVLLVGPGIGSARSQAGTGGSEHGQAISGDVNLLAKWTELFNARKWDGLGGIYEEDAVAIPPNHELIRGRAAIVEYYRGLRDSVDEVKCAEPVRVTVSGNLVSLVGDCSAYSGQLRVNTHELYERQADGSLRYRVDMFGFR